MRKRTDNFSQGHNRDQFLLDSLCNTKQIWGPQNQNHNIQYMEQGSCLELPLGSLKGRYYPFNKGSLTIHSNFTVSITVPCCQECLGLSISQSSGTGWEILQEKSVKGERTNEWDIVLKVFRVWIGNSCKISSIIQFLRTISMAKLPLTSLRVRVRKSEDAASQPVKILLVTSWFHWIKKAKLTLTLQWQDSSSLPCYLASFS